MTKENSNHLTTIIVWWHVVVGQSNFNRKSTVATLFLRMEHNSFSLSMLYFKSAHGRPQNFFQGRAKFSRRGQKHTICLKSAEKDTIFLKKSRKTYYFGRPGGGGKGPLLPSPADAHDYVTCGPTDVHLPYDIVISGNSCDMSFELTVKN